ncbi:sugar ABC transporter substrate-binding protein [Prauserella cavernicola]|uniref:Sugar ABC transporter substrate-binding protein n=1 Tax=Prauserella cavernicola TaxID=2800127 RepID=A0A934V7F2_9PSEU|nr:sugar ABC transporter substrate-binding protein [Prauserella cavernicola]MBK1787180.1 sugar ABC transporter substrate-binding protein [Prauserella cavernicola]
MKTLRGTVAALIGLLLVLVAGCGPAAEPTAVGTAAGDDVRGKRVALLTVAQSCDYCALHTQQFRAVADAAGLDLQVIVNDFDAGEQAQQINQVIVTKPDAAVVWPADAAAIMPSLARLRAAGIPVIVTNAFPQSDDDSYWATYTGPDDVENGAQAARAMVEGLKERGKPLKGDVVVLIGVPGTPGTINRYEGFTRALAQLAPDIEVVGRQPGNWDQTEATSAAATLFTQFGGPDLIGMYSQADNMLAGAVLAAQRAGIDPKSLMLVGHNCSIEAYDALASGDQYATVLQSPIDDGDAAAKAVITLLRGQPQPKNVFIANPIITRDTVSRCDAAVGK